MNGWLSFAKLAAPMLATTSSGSVDPVQTLINAGTLGVILALVITGYLVPKQIVESYKQRAEKSEEKLDAFNEVMTDKVIPALVKSTEALDRLAPFLQAEIVIRQARAQAQAALPPAEGP